MKQLLTIVTILAIAAVGVRADNASYQSTINSQNPTFYFNFDNTLGANVGSGTFTTVGSSTSFANDLSGNANDALHVGNSTSGYTLTTPNIINGAGTPNGVGSLSFLFNLSSVGGTEYFLSDSESTGTSPGTGLALDFSGGSFQFKVGNHSFVDSTYLPAPTANTWYYFAATWNFDGVGVEDTVNWWIGAVGGTLASGNNTVVPYTFADNSEVGAGGTFYLGARSTLVSSAVGSYDELATWNSQLSGNQINDQFNALAPVPEPSSYSLFCACVIFVIFGRRQIPVLRFQKIRRFISM